MDLKEIQNLIKFVAKSGASEVKLEMDDVKITIKTGSEDKETTILQQVPMAGMQRSLKCSSRTATASAPQQQQETQSSGSDKAAQEDSKDISPLNLLLLELSIENLLQTKNLLWKLEIP